MQSLLFDFDYAALYANWLTSKELVDAVGTYGDMARATMCDASVYDPEDALDDAVQFLFDENEDLLEGSDTIYFVIFIGDNFECKTSLFKRAKRVLRSAVKSRFPDEDIKIKVGIANDHKKIGNGDLSLYAFCC